ncbi:Undefined function [Listeria monocytogenes N53-1]|nr:Undefined function [Listeria monocytogenes]CCQ23066.1 Undefined function [Listeria monocytogenes N53-1]
MTGTYRIAIPNGFIKPYIKLTTTIKQDQKRITLDDITVEDKLSNLEIPFQMYPN